MMTIDVDVLRTFDDDQGEQLTSAPKRGRRLLQYRRGDDSAANLFRVFAA